MGSFVVRPMTPVKGVPSLYVLIAIRFLAIPQNSLPTASTDCHGFAMSGFASNLSR
jgi:hypothetical protein